MCIYSKSFFWCSVFVVVAAMYVYTLYRCYLVHGCGG
jgi:hypothetical protein